MRITPWIIKLEPNQIFVFGSNIQGRNGRGAALQAEKQFGAQHGIGQGFTGQCYAIPTRNFPYKTKCPVTLDLAEIKDNINLFIKDAKQNPQLEFLVTEIGCGLAGCEVKDIAPMFKECKDLENVYLPLSFWQVLNSVTLEDLLERSSKENIHKEISIGEEIGAEKI